MHYFNFDFSVGLFASSFTVSHGIILFVLSYCVTFGVGTGLPYSVLLAVAASVSFQLLTPMSFH